MFPFKTKSFSYQSKLDKQEVLKRLNVVSDFYYCKKNWKSTKKNDTVICEPKNSYKNSFRPIIVAELLSDPDGTLYISGYYRIANFVAYSKLFIVLIGVYIAFEAGNILPVFASYIMWTIFIQGIGYLFFRHEYKKTKTEFEEAIGVTRF